MNQRGVSKILAYLFMFYDDLIFVSFKYSTSIKTEFMFYTIRVVKK